MPSNTSTLSEIDWRTIEQALQVAAGSYRETVQVHGGHMSTGPTERLREEAERCRSLSEKLAASSALPQA
jgi:hypothetical protein